MSGDYVRESVERDFNLTPEQLAAPVELKCKPRLFPFQSEWLSDIAESNHVLSEADKQITSEVLHRLWAGLDAAYRRGNDAPPGYVNITNGDGGFLVPKEATPLVEAMIASGDLIVGKTVKIVIPAEDPQPCAIVQSPAQGCSEQTATPQPLPAPRSTAGG